MPPPASIRLLRKYVCCERARERTNHPPTHPPTSLFLFHLTQSLSLALLFPPFLCAPLIFCLKQFLPNCKFNILTQQFISDSQLMPLSLRARCHYYSYGDAYFALRKRKLALGNGVWANVFLCLEIFQIHQAELNEFSPEFGSLSINREIQSKTTFLIGKSNLKTITKLKKVHVRQFAHKITAWSSRMSAKLLIRICLDLCWGKINILSIIAYIFY